MLPYEISCQEVKQLLDSGQDFLFVDCREPGEHSLVSIPSAMLLPVSELVARADELEPHRDRHIVIHCHHGGRSLQATAWLRQQNFAQVQSMAGGIDAWAEQIDPSLPRY